MKESKIEWYIIGLILYRIVYTFIPFVAYYSPHGLNMFVVGALYFIVANQMGVNQTFNIFFKFIPVYFISILSILFSGVAGNGSSIILQFYFLFQDILWVILLKYIVSKNNIRLNKFLLYFVLICLITTSITTYFGCLAYPGLSRNMTGGSLSAQEQVLFSTLNIGGFDFIYTIVLVLPLIIYLYKSGNTKLIFSLILIFPIILAVYKAEYATALLFTGISLVTYFFPKFRNVRHFLAVGFALGLLCVFLSEFLSDFFVWFSNVTESDILSERLSSSGDMAKGMTVDVDSDAGARLEAWYKSFNNFLEHPIIGAGDNGGGHSWLFDNMSMFGILGLLGCLGVYYSTYKLIIRPFKNTYYYYYVLYIFVMQIVLSILNTMFFFEVFTILVPLFFYSYPSIQTSHSRYSKS